MERWNHAERYLEMEWKHAAMERCGTIFGTSNGTMEPAMEHIAGSIVRFNRGGRSRGADSSSLASEEYAMSPITSGTARLASRAVGSAVPDVQAPIAGSGAQKAVTSLCHRPVLRPSALFAQMREVAKWAALRRLLQRGTQCRSRAMRARTTHGWHPASGLAFLRIVSAKAAERASMRFCERFGVLSQFVKIGGTLLL